MYNYSSNPWESNRRDIVYMFALGRFDMDLTTSYIYHLLLLLKSIVFSGVEIPSHAGHCR